VKPGEFLTRTLDCFDRVAGRVGSRELDALVAGIHLRLMVAGDRLAGLLLDGLHPFPAAPEDGRPVAVISAFDSAETGEVPPPPPWGEGDYLPRDEVRGFTEGRWRAAYSLTNSSLWFYDVDAGRGAGWLRRPPSPESRERAVPWWPALYWALAANGRPLIHAAAVGDVLLAGPGGSGKSTSTFAAAAAGMPCAGDDYVALSEGGGSGDWTAHALYRWARLDDASLERFPEIRAVYRDDEKAGVELPNPVESVPVRAVIVPRVAARTGRPRPLSRARAARALAPSTLIQGPAGDPAVAGVLGRMLRAVPAFGLEVGPDIERIPAALAEAGEMVAA